MRLVEVKGREKWCFAAVFPHEISSEDLNKGYDVSMSLQEITLLATKLFLKGSKK